MTTTSGRGLAVTSPKLIFTDSGRNCYAYSGIITTSTSYQTFLEFQTGEDPIRGFLQINGDLDELSTSWFDFIVYFNGVGVTYAQMERNNFLNPIVEYIIPPLTTFKVQGKVQANTPDFTMNFIGRTVE
jgi:hypothetical protein